MTIKAKDVDRTSFIIVCAPRTGSNLLQTKLNSHPEIICHSELFNKDGIYFGGKQGKEYKSVLSIKMRNEYPELFVNTFYNLDVSGGPYSAVGFKILDGQNDEVMDSLLDDSGIRKIVLQRDNLLLSYLSFLEMQKTGKANANTIQDIYNSGSELTTAINFDALSAYFIRMNGFFSRIENRLHLSGQPWFPVRYHELHNDVILKSLLSFLKIKDVNVVLSTNLVKLNQRSLVERISNYHEISSRLQECGLGHYLLEES